MCKFKTKRHTHTHYIDMMSFENIRAFSLRSLFVLSITSARKCDSGCSIEKEMAIMILNCFSWMKRVMPFHFESFDKIRSIFAVCAHMLPNVNAWKIISTIFSEVYVRSRQFLWQIFTFFSLDGNSSVIKCELHHHSTHKHAVNTICIDRLIQPKMIWWRKEKRLPGFDVP